MLPLGALLPRELGRAHTPTVAIPAAPPRRVCVSRRRRPFCSRSACGVPRPAVASEGRQLLPVQETPIRNPVLPGPRQREKPPPLPRPAPRGPRGGRQRPRPLSHRARGAVPLRSTLIASPRKLLSRRLAAGMLLRLQSTEFGSVKLIRTSSLGVY